MIPRQLTCKFRDFHDGDLKQDCNMDVSNLTGQLDISSERKNKTEITSMNRKQE